MNDDQFNMSMRKFLKQVGVTSQQKIEQAVNAAVENGTISAGDLPVRVTLTIDKIGLSHTVEGDISVGDAE